MTGVISVPGPNLHKSNSSNGLMGIEFQHIAPTIYYFPINIHLIRFQTPTRKFLVRLMSVLWIDLIKPFTGPGAKDISMKFTDKRITIGKDKLKRAGNKCSASSPSAMINMIRMIQTGTRKINLHQGLDPAVSLRSTEPQIAQY